MIGKHTNKHEILNTFHCDAVLAGRSHFVSVVRRAPPRTHVACITTNIFNNLYPERLISSIRPRRVLYDKLFHRYRLKKEELNLHFSRLSLLQKVEYSRETQKRWKNLRTCFTRELRLQRREQSRRKKNLPVNKRKPYEYFEQLLFLRNWIENTEDTDHDNDKNNSGDNESTNSSDALFIENVPVDYMEVESVDLNNDLLVSRKIYTEIDGQKDKIYDKNDNINERFLDILINDKEDDDRQFVLSLIPLFKELNTTRKIEDRTDILGILQNISFRDD